VNEPARLRFEVGGDSVFALRIGGSSLTVATGFRGRQQIKMEKKLRPIESLIPPPEISHHLSLLDASYLHMHHASSRDMTRGGLWVGGAKFAC
jgi:hypothetical protein